MHMKLSVVMFKVLLLAGILLQSACSPTESESSADVFQYDQAALTGAKPWTAAEFQNDPQEFQFVVIGDRTGGANVQETFKLAVVSSTCFSRNSSSMSVISSRATATTRLN